MALEQFQNNELPEEVPAQAPEAPKQATREKAFADDATIRLQQKRLEYDAHLQNLIDKVSQRQQLNYNPKLLALGAGLLTPGKTGNFFEGLGLGAKGYMEAGEKELETDMERTKLENELRLGQIGQLEKDRSLEKELKSQQMLEDFIARKRLPQTQGGQSGVALDNYLDLAKSGDVEITPQDIVMFARYDKDKAALLEKLYDNQIRAKELGQKQFGKTSRFLPVLNEVSENLTVTQNEQIERMINRNATEEEFISYYENQGIIPKRAVKQKPTAISTTDEVTEAPEKIESPATRLRRLEIEKTQSIEDIKAAKDIQKKDIETIGKETKSAKLQELAARDMFTYADDPAFEKMFGILNSKPGYTSAFFLALKEPVRIGNTSIGVGQIEDILRLANVKDPAVIAAAERFKGLSKQIEANETRILLGGEGQITEGERRIVTTIVPTLSDPTKVVKAKAELTIARAQFDQERAKSFNAYTRQNKNATYFDFESDPNSPYQKLWSNYKNHTADIADFYSTSGAKTKRDSSATSAKSTSPVKSGGLWEAIQRAKEAE